MAVLRRASGKDPLNLKLDASAPSYWQEHSAASSYERPY